jgi:hypothetical protein
MKRSQNMNNRAKKKSLKRKLYRKAAAPLCQGAYGEEK